MKNRYFLIAALLIAAIGGQTARAQITISIPRIPKIKKQKVEQTSAPDAAVNNGGSDEQNGQKTASAGQPTERQDEPLDARLGLFLDELAKAQKEVDEYNPNDKLYLVDTTSGEWMWRAVSAKERAEWQTKWQTLMTPATQKRFDDAFAALSASAAKKLPAYKGSVGKYTAHSAAEERMMKGVLTKIADYKIFSSGLEQTNWLIDKNDYGLPTARYKHGVIYLRDTKSDHPYCYATYVNIIQDYAGGGTYGASYARFIEDEMVGCPAGAK